MDGQAGPGQNARICMICWLASAERVQRRLEQQRNGNLVPNCGMSAGMVPKTLRGLQTPSACRVSPSTGRYLIVVV